MWLNGLICACLATGWLALFGGSAHALDVVGNAPTPVNEVLPSNPQPSIASSIPVLMQFKKGLFDLGYNLQLSYIGEVLGNPTGGVKQGATNEGLFNMSVDGDLDTIAGLNGATFHINAFVIHGRGLSTFNLFDIAPLSLRRGFSRRGWSSNFFKGSRRCGSGNCQPTPNSSSAI